MDSKVKPGKGILVLQLFVAGMSQRSMEAIENVRNLCNLYLKGKFTLEIIDLYKHPEAAAEQQIIFSPSLVKLNPLPKKTMIGNFTNLEKVIKTFGINVTNTK
jgi:circadian clock protein KaiB